MWSWLWAKILTRVFGDGIGADIAGRGADYLVGEARKAVDRPPEMVTSARLRPGDTYTVVARPPATREERGLAAAKARLQARDDHLNRPTRRQLRAARRLRTAQRRLARRAPGTRRYRRAAHLEEVRGNRFDTLMAPTRRQAKVRAGLEGVTERLDRSRESSLAQVRSGKRARPRRNRVHVYD